MESSNTKQSSEKAHDSSVREETVSKSALDVQVSSVIPVASEDVAIPVERVSNIERRRLRLILSWDHRRYSSASAQPSPLSGDLRRMSLIHWEKCASGPTCYMVPWTVKLS